MMHIRNLLVAIIIGPLMLASEALNLVLGQSQDRSAAVVQAVAPVFPPLAVAAAQDGTVIADARISPNGVVKSVQIVEGHKLLRKVVEITAKRWVFASTQERTDLRTVRLSFVFKLVPKETPSVELLPIFRPPYQVEVRTRFPSITKYSTRRKHKPRKPKAS